MGTGLTEVGSLRAGGTLEGDTRELVTKRLEPLENDFTRDKICKRSKTKEGRGQCQEEEEERKKV